MVDFATGGLVDFFDQHIAGALAQSFHPLSLGAAIRWVLEDPHRRCQLGAAALRRAERLWEQARVTGLYAGAVWASAETLLLERCRNTHAAL